MLGFITPRCDHQPGAAANASNGIKPHAISAAARRRESRPLRLFAGVSLIASGAGGSEAAYGVVPWVNSPIERSPCGATWVSTGPAGPGGPCSPSGPADPTGPTSPVGPVGP